MRFGSRTALFALAVQIVLSFGHVHLYAIATGPFSWPAAQAEAIADGLPARAEPGTPIQKSDGAVDALCPICVSIQLIAGAAPVRQPAVLLPGYLGPIGWPIFAQSILAASPHGLFQARAPPSI